MTVGGRHIAAVAPRICQARGDRGEEGRRSAGHFPGGIGTHLVLHVGQLFLASLPRQVRELGVRAHGDNVTAHPLEPLLLLCQSSELGRSDEGEIGGIEKENGPALPGDLLLQAELAEIPLDGSKVVSSNSGTVCPSLSPIGVSDIRICLLGILVMGRLYRARRCARRIP